jgi:hypothetical protein
LIERILGKKDALAIWAFAWLAKNELIIKRSKTIYNILNGFKESARDKEKGNFYL